MLTRWKQPCVIWEASKLTHLVRLAEPLVGPSRCQNCGGSVRSPHALGGPIANYRVKSKLFVRQRNYRSRPCADIQPSQPLVNHLLGHFVHRFLQSFSQGEI